jgi:ribosomal protein S6--L-glutamate ligase
MRLGLITDRPQHPVVSAVVARLRERGHEVRILDAEGDADVAAMAEREIGDPADAYVLRNHGSGNMALARRVEQAGHTVLNRLSAADLCQDRFAMSRALVEAGLPWPATWCVEDLASSLDGSVCPKPLPYPVIAKSRWAGREDVVRLVRSESELAALAGETGGEPFIVQECVANDGQDRKMYVIDDTVFALRRPSPLSGEDFEARVPLESRDDWVEMARAVGRAFGLRVYGVDILVSESGPTIVDVNSFPGFRGVPGAADALAATIEKLPSRV